MNDLAEVLNDRRFLVNVLQFQDEKLRSLVNELAAHLRSAGRQPAG